MFVKLLTNIFLCVILITYIVTNKGFNMDKTTDHFYSFPAIRGHQAGREYYVSLCPLGLVHKIFKFDEVNLSPELRAQRTLNKARIPEIARYINENQDNYVFSAITASVDGDIKFTAINNEPENSKNGFLRIDMTSRIIVNDGQHRRAAIEMALQDDSSIAHETIAIVFFIDRGLKRSQQMFADLNRHAIRPSRSLGLLYDHRNDMSQIARLVALSSKAFKGLVDMEKSTLSERSKKLFTLSAIYTSCQALLDPKVHDDQEAASKLCIQFWDEVAKYMPDWDLVKKGKATSGEIRKDYLHSNGIGLQAIAIAGSQLITEYPNNWAEKITLLKKIDWSRSGDSIWEGRAMLNGKIIKSGQHLKLTSNLIKMKLQLTLSPEEKLLEESLKRK
jgi:DNA sulfur modification protein DndB